MGELLTLVTALIWAVTGLVWAEGGRRRLGILQLFTVMTSVAALFSAAVLLLTGNTQFPDIRGVGVMLVASGGIICVAAAIINAETMKSHPEHTSAIWTVFQLCMVIPFIWSVVWWHKMPVVEQWIGFGFIVAALVYLAPGGSGRVKSSEERGWFFPALAAFMANGISQTFVQESSLRGWRAAPFAKAMVISAPIAVLLWLVCVFVKRIPNLNEWRLGVFGGLVSVIGSGTMFKAFDYLESGGRQYLFFPMAVGGCIVALAAFQFATKREAVNMRKVLGMIVGFVGIILLGLKS